MRFGSCPSSCRGGCARPVVLLAARRCSSSTCPVSATTATHGECTETDRFQDNIEAPMYLVHRPLLPHRRVRFEIRLSDRQQVVLARAVQKRHSLVCNFTVEVDGYANVYAGYRSRSSAMANSGPRAQTRTGLRDCVRNQSLHQNVVVYRDLFAVAVVSERQISQHCDHAAAVLPWHSQILPERADVRPPDPCCLNGATSCQANCKSPGDTTHLVVVFAHGLLVPP